MIVFHGTNEENAKNIMKEGFNIGTYFAHNLADALENGDYIFRVALNEKKLNPSSEEKDNWQFFTCEHISRQKILECVKYEITVIY